MFQVRKEYGELKRYIFDKRIEVEKDVNEEFSSGYRGPKLLPTTDDDVFKMVFASEEGRKFACFIISLVVDVEYEYLLENLKFYKNEIDKKSLKQRSVRADCVYECDGTLFSFEMNNTNMTERNAEFAHRLYASKAVKGVATNDLEYRDVFQFCFDNYKHKEIEDTIQVWYMGNDQLLRERIVYTDIYLPNMKRKYKEKGSEGMSYAERMILAMFIGDVRDIKKLEKGGEEMIRQFVTKMKKLMRDENLMDQYNKGNTRMKANIQWSLEKGREEGREKGREEGLETTATNMLKDGLSEEVVHKYTKLPLEKIKNIAMML